MEHSYPEITLLLIEQAKATFCPDPCLLDPDWVTTALFYYQTHPQENPLSETKQDCVWGGRTNKASISVEYSFRAGTASFREDAAKVARRTKNQK